ncbi:hypothetical protein sos41_36900 [Alphaproteobacteria bacterium SO-S41]|nr:hypothetical protein sos41_36900 [Alphaproteobacteria bacterium SO-S41]
MFDPLEKLLDAGRRGIAAVAFATLAFLAAPTAVAQNVDPACLTQNNRVFNDPGPNVAETASAPAGFFSTGDSAVVFTRGSRPADSLTLVSLRCAISAVVGSSHLIDLTAAGNVALTVNTVQVAPLSSGAAPDRAAIRISAGGDVALNVGAAVGPPNGITATSAAPVIDVTAGGVLSFAVTGEVRSQSAQTCITIPRGRFCNGVNGQAMVARATGFATIDIAATGSLRSAAIALTLTSAGGLITNRGRVDGIALAGGNFTLRNFGTIGGAITTGAGDDLIIIEAGASVTGGITTAAGQDRLLIRGSAAIPGASVVAGQTGNRGLLDGIEAIDVESGGRLSIGRGGIDFIVGVSPTFSQIALDGRLSLTAGSTLEMNVGFFAGGCPGCRTTGDVITTASTIQVEGAALVLHAPWSITGLYSRQLLLSAAGGITGRFVSVTLDTAFLTPLLEYSPTRVDVVVVRNDVSFASLAASPNQRAVALAAETAGPSTALYRALLIQSAANVQTAYDLLSGEAYATASTAGIEQGEARRSAIARRLEQWEGKGFLIWGESDGDDFDLGGLPGTADAAIEQDSITIGQGFAGPDWRAGLAETYAEFGERLPGRQTSGDGRLWAVTAFASATVDGLTLDAMASYGERRTLLSRALSIGPALAGTFIDYRGLIGANPDFVDAPNGRLTLEQWDVFLEAAYAVDLDDAVLEPFVSATYVHQSGEAITEQGGGAALTVAPAEREVVFTRAGLRVRGAWLIATDTMFSTGISAGYRHASGDLRALVRNTFVAGGSTFTAEGIQLAEDVAEIGIDLLLSLPGGGVSFSYQATHADRLDVESIRVGGRLTF